MKREKGAQEERRAGGSGECKREWSTYKPLRANGLMAGATKGLTRPKGEMPAIGAVPGRPKPVVRPALIEKAEAPADMGRANEVGVATATAGGPIGPGMTAGPTAPIVMW